MKQMLLSFHLLIINKYLLANMPDWNESTKSCLRWLKQSHGHGCGLAVNNIPVSLEQAGTKDP